MLWHKFLKIFFLAIGAVLALSLAHLFLEKPQQRITPPSENNPVQYLVYAPDLDGQPVEPGAIASWAFSLNQSLQSLKEQAFGVSPVVICYTTADKQDFYQRLLQQENINWAVVTSVIQDFEKRLGIELHYPFLRQNDLRHLIELQNLNPDLTTLSVSPYYLTHTGQPDQKSPLQPEKLLLTPRYGINVPFILSGTSFSIVDKLLLVADAKTVWEIAVAISSARSIEYEYWLSGSFLSADGDKDITEKTMLDWARENPTKTFYLPAVKEYCFGAAFWGDLFWDGRAHYLLLPDTLETQHFHESLHAMPTFFQITELFNDEAETVARWIAILGWLHSNPAIAGSLKELLRQKLHDLSPLAQRNIRRYYPSIYQDYINVVVA